MMQNSLLYFTFIDSLYLHYSIRLHKHACQALQIAQKALSIDYGLRQNFRLNLGTKIIYYRSEISFLT